MRRRKRCRSFFSAPEYAGGVQGQEHVLDVLNLSGAGIVICSEARRVASARAGSETRIRNMYILSAATLSGGRGGRIGRRIETCSLRVDVCFEAAVCSLIDPISGLYASGGWSRSKATTSKGQITVPPHCLVVLYIHTPQDPRDTDAARSPSLRLALATAAQLAVPRLRAGEAPHTRARGNAPRSWPYISSSTPPAADPRPQTRITTQTPP
jgi:hypothetical protein